MPSYRFISCMIRSESLKSDLKMVNYIEHNQQLFIFSSTNQYCISKQFIIS